MKLLFFVTIFTLLFNTCQRPLTIEEKKEKDQTTRNYFKQVIDNDKTLSSLPKLPDDPEFEKSLSLTNSDIYKKHAWELWKKEMSREIKRIGLDKLPRRSTQVIWDIPQNERMKVEILVKGRRPIKGYPLFINLHGGGRDGSVAGPWDSSMNEGEWKAAKDLGARYKDSPSLYITPRMADDRKGRWYLKPQQEAFRDLIRAAVASGVVDPDRIYLLGISEGGYGSHRLSLFMPDLFTAVGPMAAAEPMGSYAVNLRNLPIRLEVGENDRGFKRVDFAREWEQKLDQLAVENPGDYKHEIVIQKGKGHGINYFDLSPWLAKQKKRSTYPKQISYQFHNLDGLLKQIYYLDFSALTFAKGEEQPLLQLTREGNQFNISIEGGTPPTGKLRIFLDDKAVDLSKTVHIQYGDKVFYNMKVTPTYKAILTSIATFRDPLRIFPAYIDIDL